jgi:ubiquitin C-terminal hydrolase
MESLERGIARVLAEAATLVKQEYWHMDADAHDGQPALSAPRVDVLAFYTQVEGLVKYCRQLVSYSSYYSDVDKIFQKVKAPAEAFVRWMLLGYWSCLSPEDLAIFQDTERLRLASPESANAMFNVRNTADLPTYGATGQRERLANHLHDHMDDLLQFRVLHTAMYGEEVFSKVIVPTIARVMMAVVPYVHAIVSAKLQGPSTMPKDSIEFLTHQALTDAPAAPTASEQRRIICNFLHANHGNNNPPLDSESDTYLSSDDNVAAIWTTWFTRLTDASDGVNGAVAPAPLDALRLYERALHQFALRQSSADAAVFVSLPLYDLIWAWNGGCPPLQLHPVVVSEDKHRTLTVCRRKYAVTVSYGDRYNTTTVNMWPHETVLDAASEGLGKNGKLAVLLEDARNVWKARIDTYIAASSNGQKVPRSKRLQFTKGNAEETVSPSTRLEKCASTGAIAIRLSVDVAPAKGRTLYAPGHCGLSNIGNTCYMNSALQCLSNTRAFRDCIMGLAPAGLEKSPVAVSLHHLFKSMWSGQKSSVTPSEFKTSFTSKFRRFEGYDQQDSIEFVNALLDVVLEELNPVKTKKYVERSDERDAAHNDQENSDIYWRSYCENNVGFVFDQFYGQMRSELTCLTCGNVACAYDAFSCIPLALETATMTSLDLKVLFMDGSRRAFNVRVRVPDKCTVLELRTELHRTLRDVSTDAFTGNAKLRVSNEEFVSVGPEHIAVVEHFNGTPTLQMGKEVVYNDGKSVYVAFVLPGLEHYVERPRRLIAAKKEAEAKAAKAAAAAAKEAEAAKATATTADGDDATPAKAADLPTKEAEPSSVILVGPSQDPDETNAAEATAATPAYLLIRATEEVASADNKHRGLDLMVAVPTTVTEAAACRDILATLAPFLVTEDGPRPARVDELADVRIKVDETELRHDSEALVNGLRGASRSYRPSLVHTTAVVPLGFKLNYTKADDDKSLTKLPSKDYVPPQRTLLDLLEAMVKAQDLKGADQWYCSKCKQHQDARKTDTIYRLPEYLVLQLKRFYVGSDGFTMRKVETPVPFPDELDLRPYVSDMLADEGRAQYKLYGVVNHSGSLSYGHYTATALVRKTAEPGGHTTVAANDDVDSASEADAAGDSGAPLPSVRAPELFDEPREWVEFNDSSAYVSSRKPSETAAYLLFYERVPARPSNPTIS